MKNLLIYITPSQDLSKTKLNGEAEVLAKVQIDNSLELGWKKEDIWLITNFIYEYRGVKSFVFNDHNYCEFAPTASKINVIAKLLERKFFYDELYWFHDLDAFQLEAITEGELGMERSELGLTRYGPTTINKQRDKRWSTGSLFFKKGAKDIFDTLKAEVYKYQKNEEVALLEMLKKKRNRPLAQQIKDLNITYNLATRKRDISRCYEVADKPIKVLHFHPFDDRPLDKENGHNNMDVCVYGRNRMGRVLVTERLRKVFNAHGIK